MQVLVTGAGGKTGSIVVRKLLERGTFKVRALVRSKESGDALKAKMGDLSKDLEVVLGDIMQKESLAEAFKDVEGVVVVTSAMPQIDKLSLVKVIGIKVLTFGQVSRKPEFWYHEGQNPERVDWVGQRNQIEAAKAAGVKHIVMVSSMGGTKPDHFLNTHLDKIVLWKRKAEKYLIDSGLAYTIIHPGGLLPHPGPQANVPAPGGKRELVLSVDDKLGTEGEKLKEEGKVDEARHLIPREDVAEICVQSLLEPDAKNRSFDLGACTEGKGTVYDGNFKALLATLNGANCSYETPALPESSL
mmetsp:Transcript_68166/g.142437  ORF Transcript_68166/g.142437 Transcript_68166/m.142437 type:complete len:301 (+) Transcript_68166:173-1075(+)|eukprot:CAMPEP_0206459430 /NCGR_PEP_ID=MMETSP0324_2-20121206/24168_1 /ASSEMBLY_ACC=CAM_ASM_000836 /TAXON_ID=2866 /ORGANISM="Crypthecodinium cohnii, Strain Seligo" /LENGTH=300 /DNA_ID=CAMNT_0053930973 /DNA_START=159 /DNA_END=1061 /DNA_ORIENTATION=+